MNHPALQPTNCFSLASRMLDEVNRGGGYKMNYTVDGVEFYFTDEDGQVYHVNIKRAKP